MQKSLRAYHCGACLGPIADPWDIEDGLYYDEGCEVSGIPLASIQVTYWDEAGKIRVRNYNESAREDDPYRSPYAGV